MTTPTGGPRVPSDLVRLVLAEEAARTGRPHLVIKPASLRNWTRRGYVTRTPEGYDLREVMAYIERREQRGRLADQAA